MSPAPTPPGADDAVRDAWLREALRHAPDADAAPPAELSEAILREAAAKAPARSVPRRAAASPWARWWSWLAQPSVGAGLASVMVACVIGAMWWEGPTAGLSSRGSVDTAVGMAPAAAPAPASAPPAANDSAPPAANDSAETSREAAVVTRAPAAAPVLPARASRRALEDKALNAPPPSAPIVVAPAAPQPAADAVATAAAPASPPPAPAAAATSERNERGSPPPALAKAQARSVQGSLAAALAPAGPRSLEEIRAAVAADPARWTWRRGGDAVPAADPALQALLVELDAVVAVRLKPALPDAAAGTPAGTLYLLRDGRVVYSLWLDARVLRWQRSAPGDAVQSWQADLDDRQVERLQHALDKLRR